MRRLIGITITCTGIIFGSASAQHVSVCRSTQTSQATPAIDTTSGCGVNDPLPDLAAVSATVGKVLNFDFSTDPYSFVSAAVGFSDNALKQKLTLSPLKLTHNPAAWDALSIGAVNANSTSTFSLGVGYDWMAHYSPRRRQAYAHVTAQKIPPITPRDDETPTSPQFQQRVQREQDSILSSYWEDRFRNTVAITGTAYVQTFSALSATKVDLDNDGKADNAYATKGYGGTAQLLYRWNMRTNLAVGGQLGRRRASAIEGTPLRPYRGASITVTHLAMVLDTGYLHSKDYRTKLYIPSVTAGLSFEWQQCRGAPLECDNQVREQKVLTPFLDVRLPGGAQFRLGLPFRRDRVGDKTGTRVEPLAQLGWAMSSL